MMERYNTSATIYQRDVADVCLTCPFKKCVSAGRGCELFKARWNAAVKQSNRKGKKPNLKEAQ